MIKEKFLCNEKNKTNNAVLYLRKKQEDLHHDRQQNDMQPVLRVLAQQKKEANQPRTTQKKETQTMRCYNCGAPATNKVTYQVKEKKGITNPMSLTKYFCTECSQTTQP